MARFAAVFSFIACLLGIAGVAPSAASVFTVVVDPGHGGNDHGARAFGVREADLALDISLRVRRHLRRLSPRSRVLLTRDNDTFLPLEQRPAFANAMHANLFVSVHLNAAWEDVAVERGGIATFVLDTTNDRQASRLAARENGVALEDVSDLSRLIANVSRAPQRRESRFLATSIQSSLLARARRMMPDLFDRGVRSSAFRVLVGAQMPAVLVESSFLTRAEEAERLQDERYRDSLARGIAEGIVQYQTARSLGVAAE